ncbi:MAG TPA: hypothetical protein VMT32_07160 [Bryobacteraceae bacterium]|jgi:hypothetical protein|nr:hypothetical protein [Bryobacteraceae bacterium]
MARPAIKLNPSLWDRIVRCAEAAGYSSPQEFIEHILEKELAKIEVTDSEDEILKKLKGLGYIE